MEMLAIGLLASVWFWPVLFIVLLLLLASDSEWWATSVLVVVGGVWWYYLGKNIDWMNLLTNVGYYVGLGLLFTFAKYGMVSWKEGKRLKEFRPTESYAERARLWNKDSSMQETRQLVKVAYNEQTKRWDTSYDTWKLSRYLTKWAAFWPAYLVLIVFEDMLREFMHMFAAMFGKGYRWISDKTFNLA